MKPESLPSFCLSSPSFSLSSPYLSSISLLPLSLLPGIQLKTLVDSMTPEPLACHAVNIPSQEH